MNIKGEKSRETKSVVGISLWDRRGNLTKEGKKSLTFTIEGTTMDELADFIKKAIRESD